MPIYEYECMGCGRVSEALQKFSDKPLETCDACSGALRKLVSHSSFHLKGSGWYVTDYADRSKKPSDSNSAGKKAQDSQANAPKKSADAKPDKKSDKKKAD
ncbi:FmdB family transcriptional regulator [Candidatus Desulfarcum epimagneticum]|uniref:FmdB family transcriptional regulator n=1 Tax=uncultured Desulfobacteraceae bacterium TaxID=218296 RepID=A0A484HCW5_9BACT|nr:FmdB family transcriptional regulator [uncultured Desulfobacteraceae bacterium]